MYEEVKRLMQARTDAIERGDKALGREIYHQLETMGLQGEDIDLERVAAPAVAEAPIETTEAAPAPERAVKPRAKKG